MGDQVLVGSDIFDGEHLGPGALHLADGRIASILRPTDALPAGAPTVELDGGILAPGFVDLQVNGGGGVLLNDAPTPETVATIVAAHAGLGALTILPTLISDTADVTARAIDAVASAVAAGVQGVGGLHLEGPHLGPARKGAHDPARIRPMSADDLAMLLAAAARLPRLMVTLAPEAVGTDQIATLARAGIIVSLGHSDAGFEPALAAVRAGARCATHLFNAMSPLGHREPGLVGAVLASGGLDCGLIADAVHVHPAAIGAALAAKAGPGGFFLVSDAMATAGSAISGFALNGRWIGRANGRLTLADGTLAGADLDLARALRVMTGPVGLARDRALAMATSLPARVLGRTDRPGCLTPGMAADLIHLTTDLHLAAVWRGGQPVTLSPACREPPAA